MAGKYRPLGAWLENQSRPSATLAFVDIERIIGDHLPPSAHEHRAWWANDAHHVEAQAWLEVGWRTVEVDLPAQQVVFARDL